MNDTGHRTGNISRQWRQDWAEGEFEVVGDRGILTTDGQGHLLLAGVTLELGIRLDRQNVAIELKGSGFTSLETFELRLYPNGDDTTRYAGISIPCVADSEANFLQSGEWSEIHLSLASGELYGMQPIDCRTEMRDLRIAMQDKCKGKVELQVRSIKGVPRTRRGCISLHFDDAYAHHGQEIPQLLRAYSTPEAPLKATAFVMPRQLGEYGYLTLDDCRRLVDEYGWEMGAHHHEPVTDMSHDRFVGEMDYILEVFHQQGWANDPIHFAYPLGKMNRLRRQQVGDYFASGRLIAGGIETLPVADWYRLRVINVTPRISAQQLTDIARRAIEHGAWAIFMFHHIVEKPNGLTEYAREEFERFLGYLRDRAYKTTLIRDLFPQN